MISKEGAREDVTSQVVYGYNVEGDDIRQPFIQRASDWLIERGIPPIAILFFVVCVSVQIVIITCLLLRCMRQRKVRTSHGEDYEKLAADYFLVTSEDTLAGASRTAKAGDQTDRPTRTSKIGRSPRLSSDTKPSTSDSRVLTKPPVTVGKFSPQPPQESSGKIPRRNLPQRGVSLKEDATTAAKKRALFAVKKSQSTPENLFRASLDTPDFKEGAATSFGEEIAQGRGEIAPPAPYGKVSFAITYDKEVEQLRVFLEQMSNLAVRTHKAAADTFAKVSLSPDHGIPSSLTRVVRKTNSPVYRQNFTFRVTPEAVRELVIKFQVFELDNFSHNDPIGELEYSLSQDHDLGNAVTLWRDLKKPEMTPNISKGELLISLTYLPNAEKLTLVVLKARNLRLAEWGTQPAGKSVLDSFVKITLVKSGKVMKYKQTRICRKSCHPVYNEGFALKIRQSELDDVCLTLAVCVRLNHLGFHRVIGRCIVGRHVGAEGASHWRDMIASPRSGVGQWHALV